MEARVINEGRNYNPHRKLDILKWMQAEQKKNQRVFKDTTAKTICAMYAIDNPGTSTGNLQAIFTKLVKDSYIMKHRTGGYRATFKINYLHPSLPRDFVMQAPDDDKQFIQNVADRVAEKKDNGDNVSVTADGTIVTKPKAVEETEPKAVQASVPVSIEKDGQSFTITININLNLKG